MPGAATEFETALSFGDDCPVCGSSVRATVEGERITALNPECVQHGDDGARYIFHQDWEADDD